MFEGTRPAPLLRKRRFGDTESASLQDCKWSTADGKMGRQLSSWQHRWLLKNFGCPVTILSMVQASAASAGAEYDALKNRSIGGPLRPGKRRELELRVFSRFFLLGVFVPIPNMECVPVHQLSRILAGNWFIPIDCEKLPVQSPGHHRCPVPADAQ